MLDAAKMHYNGIVPARRGSGMLPHMDALDTPFMKTESLPSLHTLLEDAREQQEAKKSPKKISCATCKTLFLPKRPWQKYCREKCSLAAFTQRKTVESLQKEQQIAALVEENKALREEIMRLKVIV